MRAKVTDHGLVTVGGKQYRHLTYGVASVWDDRLGKWRRPRTAAEKSLQKMMSADLQRSLREITK